jgi:hypothetical protein
MPAPMEADVTPAWTEGPGRRGPPGWQALAAVALGLMAVGLGLRWIALANTDLPPLPDLIREARELYEPALQGVGSAGRQFLRDPAPATRAWKLAWLAIDGQWDPRLLAVAALPLQAAALGLLFAALGNALRPRPWLGLGLGILSILVWSPLAARPTADAAGSSVLVVLSLLHLALMAPASPRKGRWGWGLLCGLVNVALGTAGIASAATLTVMAFFRPALIPADRPRRRFRLGANGALVLFGLALAATRSGGTDPAPVVFRALAAFSWPFVPGPWAAIVWAPALVCLGREWRRRTAFSPLAVLALWSVAQTIAFAALRIRAPSETLLAGVLINAACVLALPRKGWRRPMRNVLLAGLWSVALANVLLFPPPALIPAFSGPAVDAPATAALRRTTFTGAADPFLRQMGLGPAVIESWLKSVRDADFRRILPGSIRPPLTLEPEPSRGDSAFTAAGVPILPGQDDLPALGTWRAAGPAATGDFISQPLTTTFPLVQIRVGGQLRPPATSLGLRTEDGREVGPLQDNLAADARWRRVNFAAPPGMFRVVAHAAGPAVWLAFTAPAELARPSWLAGKLAASWAWWLAGGIAAGVASAGAAAAGRARGALAPPPQEERERWGLLPWLALLAYAVFFSHQLDSTAGPNDSGGYLNSAKFLIHGRITGAPRTLPGFVAGESDASPYVPITFHANAAGRLVPEYPVGFPLEIWALAQFTAISRALPILLLAQLVLGVVATRGLAQAMGLPDGWAWLAAGLVGLSPLYLFMALQPLSDGPALVWVTAAVAWAWSSRARPWQSVLAGLATGLAVLIRPADLLVALPVLICLTGSWRQLAGWALGCLPAALGLMAYHHRLYGSSFVTGYGDVSDLFALHFVVPTLRSYARWLPELFTPVVLLAAAGPFLRAIPLRIRLVLTSWVMVFFGFYACYWCTFDSWFNLRFVLPAAPPLIVLALFALREGWNRWGRLAGPRGFVPAVALAGVLFGFLIWDGLRAPRQVLYWMHSNRQHAVAAQWAGAHLPADAVVFAKHASGSLIYYTDLLFVRSDLPRAQTARLFAEIARTGRPIFAVLYRWEGRGYDPTGHPGDGTPDLPGNWERIAALWDNEVFVWAWRPGPPAAH